MKRRRARRASSKPTHRLALTGAATVIALAGCGGTGGVKPGDALFQAAGLGHGLVDVKINEPIFLDLAALRTNPGTHPIHLLKAVMLGAPPGLVVDHVWAERLSQGGGFGGTGRGVEAFRIAQPNLHDVSQVTLDPMCGPAAKCQPDHPPYPPIQDWYLGVQAHLSRPGSYAARGLQILYEIDGQKYVQVLNYRIALSSGGEGSLPPI